MNIINFAKLNIYTSIISKGNKQYTYIIESGNLTY